MDYADVGASRIGQDWPNVSQRNDSTAFEKNVTVLKLEDAIVSNGTLFSPNNMDLARIKKKEGRYKKGVQFNKEMDEIAVRERLINDLPILKDKRFCCAARKSQGMAELDFVRNPRRVWDGKTIRRRLPGSSALFILIEEDEEDFSSFHDTEVEDFDLDTFVGDRLFEEQIGKNEKLRSSQVTKDLTDSSGQTDSGACSEDNTAIGQPESTSVRESKMDPSEGPLTGGGKFTAEVDIELPQSMEIGWATFGHTAVKVKVARDGLSMFGNEIPGGDKPGPVSVIFTTLYGDPVAKGVYTYKERRPEYPKNNVQNKHPKRTVNDVVVVLEETIKRIKSFSNESQGSEERASEYYHQIETLFQLVDGLQSVVDTVASIYSSARPYISRESWEEIALYLEEIAKRLPAEDETMPLLSAGDVGKNQTQSLSNQVAEDQAIEEEHLGDAEISEEDSESESTDRKGDLERDIDERSLLKDVPGVQLLLEEVSNYPISESGYFGDAEISEDSEEESSDSDVHVELDTDEGLLSSRNEEKLVARDSGKFHQMKVGKQELEKPESRSVTQKFQDILEKESAAKGVLTILIQGEVGVGKTSLCNTLTRLLKASVGNEVLSRGQSATQFPNECSQKTRNLRKSFEKLESRPKYVVFEGYEVGFMLVKINHLIKSRHQLLLYGCDGPGDHSAQITNKQFHQMKVGKQELEKPESRSVTQKFQDILEKESAAKGVLTILILGEAGVGKTSLCNTRTRLLKASVGNEVLSRGQSATQFPNECSQKTRNLRKSFEKEIKDYINTTDQFIGNAPKQTEQGVVEDLTCKVDQISENLENLQKILSDIKSSLNISELKEETLTMQRKFEFIERHSRTLEEVYTKVTRMTSQACACDEFVRRKFYDFTYYNLKAVHNDLNSRVADLKSADTNFTEEENEKLQILLADQEGREKQVAELEATRTRLFSGWGRTEGISIFNIRETKLGAIYSSADTKRRYRCGVVEEIQQDQTDQDMGYFWKQEEEQ